MIVQRPVLTIPSGRAADWHQRIGTCETLPPPKNVALRKSLPQPVWELRLNPDYGTLPGLPLLEALQGVGVLGADFPIYSDRRVMLNIYVRAERAIGDSPGAPFFVLTVRFLFYFYSGRNRGTLTTRCGSRASTSHRCR
jgi:hypothetical protein